jgi:hypothetical protein
MKLLRLRITAPPWKKQWKNKSKKEEKTCQ